MDKNRVRLRVNVKVGLRVRNTNNKLAFGLTNKDVGHCNPDVV